MRQLPNSKLIYLVSCPPCLPLHQLRHTQPNLDIESLKSGTYTAPSESTQSKRLDGFELHILGTLGSSLLLGHVEQGAAQKAVWTDTKINRNTMLIMSMYIILVVSIDLHAVIYKTEKHITTPPNSQYPLAAFDVGTSPGSNNPTCTSTPA